MCLTAMYNRRRDKMKQYNGYKKCTRCECVYPIMMFHKDKNTSDGLNIYCKDCNIEKWANWRENNKEKISKRSREYRKDHKESIKDWQKKHRWKYKEDRMKYAKSTRGKYISYKNNSKRKGRLFDLPIRDFDDLIKSDCVYCGGYDNPNGIDRVDNSIGYVSGNVVPCCEWCNRMKLAHSEEEFREHLKKMYNYWLKEIK